MERISETVSVKKTSVVNYQKIVEDTAENCNEIIANSITYLKYKGKELCIVKNQKNEDLDFSQ